ncbi:MAG TPA: hypothetical protein PKK72_05390 [Chitinophagales bacterium]|nr:hypothetical protein [Chitinophagales bacterium]HNM07998.1 hypothetical protein [Chitinophagales bacterium]HNM29673.1 hypothetical protein [Chitinophagales bacterium]
MSVFVYALKNNINNEIHIGNAIGEEITLIEYKQGLSILTIF